MHTKGEAHEQIPTVCSYRMSSHCLHCDEMYEGRINGKRNNHKFDSCKAIFRALHYIRDGNSRHFMTASISTAKKLMDKFFCVASINMNFILPKSNFFCCGWNTRNIFLQLWLYKGHKACSWHNKFMESGKLKYELLKRTLILSLLLLDGKLLAFVLRTSFTRGTD